MQAKFLVLWFFVFYPFQLPAHEAKPLLKDSKLLVDLMKQKKLGDQDLEQIFFWIHDDSSALFNEGLTLWKGLSATDDPLLKARIGWMLGKLHHDEEHEDLDAILRETIELIDRHGLPLPRFEIVYFQQWLEVISGKANFTDASDKLLAAAHRIDSSYGKAAAIGDVAFEFGNRSIRTNEIPRLLTELRQILDYQRAEITSVNIGPMYAISTTLAVIDESDQAQKINQKLEAFCDANRLRALCGSIYYDRGLALAKKDDVQNTDLAIQKFQKSLELREDIHDAEDVAGSHYGLMRAYNKARNYKQAIKYGSLAVKTYEKLKLNDWAAAAYKHLSEAYLGAGDKIPALDAARKSLAICPPEIKSLLVGIYKQLSEVYDAFHRYDESNRYLKLYMEVEKATRTDDVAKKYLELGLKLEEERSAKLKEHLQAEEEKNNLLKKQNELQARDLELTQRLRVVAFILLILLGVSAMLVVLAVRRGRIIMSAKEKIQYILDNIDEGLMTIDGHMQIMTEHSAYAQRLFPQSGLAGQDVFEVIFRKSDAAVEDLSLWHESLKACLGEDSIAWEFNSEHFPRQIIIPSPQKQILSLHWQPLLHDGIIQKFLLSIRDVTSVRALEAEIASERQRREGMQKQIMEILSHNFNEAKRLIYDLGQALPALRLELSQAASRAAWLRRLHTSKGVARSLGLQTLSRAIHKAEDALKAGVDDTVAEQAVDQLAAEQSSYAYVFEEVLGAPEGNDSLNNLFDTINTLLPDIDQRLKDAALILGGVEVHDNIMHWNKALLKDVRDILVHSLANAVDHGFILPLGRGKTPGIPHFTIQADQLESGIALTIRDNGAGLDWARLKVIAQQKGFVPSPDQNLADVLLLDGVSTAEKVSETSGRGVGLAAVHSICKERQGQLRIGDNPDGPGTCLEIRLRAS